MKLYRGNVFINVIILLSFFPPIISVLMSVLSIGIPAYIFSFFCVFFLFLSFFYRKIKISLSREKIFFILFFIWILIGASYSISAIESKNKIIFILYTILLPVFFIECWSWQNIQRLIDRKFEQKCNSLSIKLIWLLSLFVFLFKEYKSDRLVLPGLENPIWLTRYVGMIILSIYYSYRNTYLQLVSLMVALLLMILIGSRTPFIALLFCVILMRMERYSLRKNLQFIGLLLMLMLLTFVLISNSYLLNMNWFSLYERFNFYSFAQSADLNYWLGKGTGSFGLFYFGEDIEAYPHNCFLELFLENGILGVLLFLILLIFFVVNYEFNLINLFVVYFFINALSSGDIVGNNLLYVFLYISYLNRINEKNIICIA